MSELSVEEMCRRLLRRAVDDGLVLIPSDIHGFTGESPEHLSSGDLVGMANLLAEYLGDAVQRYKDDWRIHAPERPE